MIIANITLKQNLLNSFTITGHGDSPAGTDIVCAGVSSISQTVLGILLEYFGKNITYIKEKGFLQVEMTDVSYLKRKNSKIILEVITRTLITGLNYISNNNPGRLKITLQEEK